MPADRLEFTTEQKDVLKRLKKASRCIPKGLSHDILGFSERRRKDRAAEAEGELFFFYFLILIPLAVFLMVFISSWVSTKWEEWS
jgi:hypothetical protein